MPLIYFFDANGYEWAFDEDMQAVYIPEVMAELTNEADREQEGYYARTLEEAMEILKEAGYMDKEKKEK